MRSRSASLVPVAQVAPVQEDAPLGRLVQARQQLDERRLAGAVLAHQRQALALGDEDVDVAQGPLVVGAGIAEADTLEADALLGAARGHAAAALARPAVGIAR